MFGTDEMLAAVGEDLCLQKYKEGQWNQMWICEVTWDYRIGMRNRHTKLFLCWRENNKVGCAAQKNLSWEWLTFKRLGLGGYSLMVSLWGAEKRRPLERVGGKSPYIKVGGVVNTQFGLHKLKNKVFRRFE